MNPENTKKAKNPWEGPIPVRQNLEDKFCRFLNFSEEQGWHNSPINDKLKDNLAECLLILNLPGNNRDEVELLNHFLHISRNGTSKPVKEKACLHVTCYLQIISLKAVRGAFNKFKDFDYLQETWDVYQEIAQDLVNHKQNETIDVLLNKYLTQTRKKRLKPYLTIGLQSKIRNEFFKKTGYGKYTIWYQLKIISNIQLKQKLRDFGFRDETYIKNCIQAKYFLYKVYSNSERGVRWPPPTDKHYQQAFEMARPHLFIRQFDRFSKLIKDCIEAINPPKGFILNSFQSVPKKEDNSVIQELRSQELRIQELSRLSSVFGAVFQREFDKFQDVHKLFLSFRYSFTMKNSELSRCSFFKGYATTVARQLSRCELVLLEAGVQLLSGYGTIDTEQIDSLDKFLKNYWLKDMGKQYLTSKIVGENISSREVYAQRLNQLLPETLSRRSQEKIQEFLSQLPSN